MACAVTIATVAMPTGMLTAGNKRGSLWAGTVALTTGRCYGILVRVVRPVRYDSDR